MEREKLLVCILDSYPVSDRFFADCDNTSIRYLNKNAEYFYYQGSGGYDESHRKIFIPIVIMNKSKEKKIIAAVGKTEKIMVWETMSSELM